MEETKTGTFAMVFIQTRGSDKFEGFGRHKFEVLPRVGDHVAIDSINTVFRVAAVVHPLPAALNSAGDIYGVELVETGTTTELIRSLNHNGS